MTNEELVNRLLAEFGGRENVVTATNCMTRLRIHVKDDSLVKDEAIKQLDGVLGVVHDRTQYIEVVVGPGKSRKCADICAEMGIPAAAEEGDLSTGNDWKTNKAAVKAGQKNGHIKSMLKTFGEIFEIGRAHV